jgi:hypothetical protein
MLRIDVLVGSTQFAFQDDTWSIYLSRSRWGAALVVISLASKAATASSELKQYRSHATRSRKTAVEDLELERPWVVYPGKAAYPPTEKTQVIPLADVPDTWNYG